MPQRTYWARVTDGRERYSLGLFLTPEACQNAIDEFRAPTAGRGQISRTKGGRWRARLEIGTFDTRWAAERSIKAAAPAVKATTAKLVRRPQMLRRDQDRDRCRDDRPGPDL